MQNLFMSLMVITNFSVTLLADSRGVARSLSPIEVESVERKGQVLRRNQMFPVETFLVGIPAHVSTGSACVDFAGQQTTVKFVGEMPSRGRMTTIEVMGSQDPRQEACIEILPAPVHTTLTLEMQHYSEHVTVGNPYVTELVVIGRITYSVSLNPKTEEVRIHPVRVR